ncbi:MAG: hypothetical protein ABI234_17870 [Ktedonobacteraceae bacterium]
MKQSLVQRATRALLLLLLCGVLSACEGLDTTSAAGAIAQPTLATSSPYVLPEPPTVSASFINRVLLAYHSPAAGLGQTMLDDGQHFRIDPVYALAWFLHEDGMGTTGWGALNRSLGNTRCSQGYSCRGGYRAYPSWAAGFWDWFHLLRVLYIDQWHLSTVAAIVPVYAPSSDHNDVAGYISAIEQSVDTWRAGRVLV